MLQTLKNLKVALLPLLLLGILSSYVWFLYGVFAYQLEPGLIESGLIDKFDVAGSVIYGLLNVLIFIAPVFLVLAILGAKSNKNAGSAAYYNGLVAASTAIFIIQILPMIIGYFIYWEQIPGGGGLAFFSQDIAQPLLVASPFAAIISGWLALKFTKVEKVKKAAGKKPA